MLWPLNTESASHSVTRSFFAAASDSYGCAGPSMLARKSGWIIMAHLHQHRRTSRRSVKVYPRCGSKKDLVTAFLPGFLNGISHE